MTQLFYAYATADARQREQLEKHLRALKQRGAIESWESRAVAQGAGWRGEVSPAAKKADIVLLLMSSDLISSGYTSGAEVSQALERHSRGEARVIPVLLRPCNMKGTPLGALTVLPRDGKPVTRWSNADAAWLAIANGLAAPAAAPALAATAAPVQAPAAGAAPAPVWTAEGAIAPERIALQPEELGPGFVALDQPKQRDDAAPDGEKYVSLARAGGRRLAQLVYRVGTPRDAVSRLEAAVRAEVAKGGRPEDPTSPIDIGGAVVRRVASAGQGTPQVSVFGAKGRFLVAAKVMGSAGESGGADGEGTTLPESVVRRMLARIPD